MNMKDRINKEEKDKFIEMARKGYHPRKRPTSFHIHDQRFIFKELDIKQGNVFLDLGCGIGEYALHAVNYTKETGFVYAIDVQHEAIENLKNTIKDKGIKNIHAITSDITKPLPLKDNSVDICLIATVLHALDFKKAAKNIFNEIFRILKPGGRLVTIDCKKEDTGFGPPIHMRISPKELEQEVLKCGFDKLKLTDLEYFYMYQFTTQRY